MAIIETINFDEVVKKVAEYFQECMEEGEFETFEEMKDCYWWDSNDIKNEVEAVIADYDWCLTDDRTEISPIAGDEYYSYKSFIAKVYKAIK